MNKTNTKRLLATVFAYTLCTFHVFLIMKLTHSGNINNWSWTWVVSPLWIMILLLMIPMIIGVIKFYRLKNKLKKEMYEKAN